LFKWAGALTLAYFVGFHVNEARSEQKLKDIGVITADIKQREVMMAEAGLAMMKEGMSQSNPDALMSLYREEAVEPENTETATGLLHSASSSFNINGGSVHCTRLGANIPNHTTVTYAGLDERMPWRAACLGIYDGYGGGGTAYYLADNLVTKILADMFAAQNVIKRDADVSSIIKSAFAEVDRDLLDSARQLLDSTYRTADIVNFSSPALSGSCALIALFDPQKKILHVANAGDSRAVLGRWDPQAEKYVAIPLSTDHNGYSQHEVARLRKEHPKEKVVDPETGEFLELPVTRAFGLAAFKWPADVTRAACERIWAPRPKHADSRRTPPYLTAEPEVAQTDVRGGGDHPDFLITVCHMEQSAQTALRYMANSRTRQTKLYGNSSMTRTRSLV
jgi:pyruvate dehydrogenase phosphatase